MDLAAPLISPAEQQGRVRLAAEALVEAGKVVPGLVVDTGGTARSEWWPLPGVGDRTMLRGLLAGDDHDDHVAAAEALTAEVDRLVRARLAGAPVVASRGGRRTVPHAWLESLSRPDATLPASLSTERIAAFAALLADAIRAGAAPTGRARLGLRVHEPGAHPEGPPAPSRRAKRGRERWWVELLLRDAEEPSLVVPIADMWAGRMPFPAGSTTEVVADLGRVVAIAPELAPALDHAHPTGVALATDELVGFVEARREALAELGTSIELPSWWAGRQRVQLRARASSSTRAKGGIDSNLGFDQIVAFRWEAALGDRRLTKADLDRLAAAVDAKQTLVQLRGEWVHVQADDLRRVLARAGDRGQTSLDTLVRASLGLAGLGDDTDAERAGDRDVDSDIDLAAEATFTPGRDGPVEVVASGWLGELLDDVHHATVSPCPTPPGFDGALRPYQERGAGWLGFLGQLGLGACLADDMGLGKTAQLIASLLDDPGDGPALVVCPVSVLGNWTRELDRFAPELTVTAHHGRDRHDHEQPFGDRAGTSDVVVTTYSLLARDRDALAEVPWGRIVLDEAQQIKNPGTVTARAARSLTARRRIALTGTPVENRLAELWSIMAFLNPGLLGSATSFQKRFARPIERDDDTEAADALQRMIRPFVLRRLKTDKTIIDDLPDKVETVDHCILSPEQASLYQAVVDDLLAAAAATDGIGRRGAVLAGIARLKQVCNHPAHYLSDGSDLDGRSGKLDRALELLDEIIDAGDKVLCFTQFTEWGDRLVDHLARRYGTAPLWLHGGVPRVRREEMMEAFADDDGPPIFLLSLKAGGTGLNLTAASHVVHLDRWWNPAVEDQATDRAYRIGQRRAVMVHKLVTAGTIEERIDEMITAKRALADKVVGDGEGWITELDLDDLRDVVALRDGAGA